MKQTYQVTILASIEIDAESEHEAETQVLALIHADSSIILTESLDLDAHAQLKSEVEL